MKEGFLYCMCKALNWILPIILCILSVNRKVSYYGDGLTMILIITYIVFWNVRANVIYHGRSRMIYEACIFTGMIFYLIVLYKRIEWIGFGITTDYSEMAQGIKILVSMLSIIIMVMRVIVMIMETDDYNAQSQDRKIRRVESAVEDARARLKTAIRTGDKQKKEEAEADLEVAKDNRDRYYNSLAKRERSNE